MSFRDWFFPLKPLGSEPKRPYIMAFDTEDNGQGAPHNFICGCVYEDDGQIAFWSRDDMRRHLFKQHHFSTMSVAHNLAYDLNNIDYPEMTAERLNGRTKLIGATYHFGDNKQMRMLDTGNFFVGASIDKLGEQLGYKKLGCKCDLLSHKDPHSTYDESGICKTCGMFNVMFLRNKKQSDLSQSAKSVIEEYCMRDSEICYMTMKKLLDLTYANHTRFKCFTAPSLATRIFRTNHMGSRWHKRTMLTNDVERLSYYGGRTEVFDYRYFEYVYAEDIRSSYPCAMHDKVYPYPSNLYQLKLPLEQALKFEGISLVSVRVPYMHIPPLPYRREDGKLIFPVGEWSAAYTHPEIKMAMRHGVEITGCHESLIYPDTFRPFTAYVDQFYHLKDTTKGIDREFYKLLLNSLSGKFSERRFQTICEPVESEKLLTKLCQCHTNHIEPEQIPGTNLCSICNKPAVAFSTVEIEDGLMKITGSRQADPAHAFPILIAYITAYGRIKLFEDRLMHGNNARTIIYTDSVTGNRCTTIRKNGMIDVVSFEELFDMVETDIIDEHGKDIKHPDDIEALTYKDGKPVFRKINRIIRHMTDKPIVLTTQKFGCSETTTDHSYMTAKGKTSPIEMLSNNMISLSGIPQSKTILDASMPNLESELLLCLAYISDGSVSDKETSCRNMFSIAKDDKAYLDGLSVHFEKVFGFKPSIIQACKSKRTGKITYALRSARLDVCRWFKSRCGQGAMHKKLPSFIFNIDLDKWMPTIIDALKSGDGSDVRSSKTSYSAEHQANHLVFCSSSLKLISGIDLLLKMSGKVSTIVFREYKPEKYVYTIASADKWNTFNRSDVITMPHKPRYVYDLEVDDTHTFVDSCGHILLHNTDSCMATDPPDIAIGPDLGNWERVTYEQFIAYAPKYYDFGHKITEDGKRIEGTLKLKGVPKRHAIVYLCPYCPDEWETPEDIWKTNGGFCTNCAASLDDSCKRRKFERPLKAAEAARRHMAPNTWISVLKNITTIDNKRHKNRDGSSSPLTIIGKPYNSFQQMLMKQPRVEHHDPQEAL